MDPIDREAAINLVKNGYYYMTWVDRAMLIEELKDLPSAQKKGHWIFVHPLQEDDPGAYMCSECNVGNWEIDPENYFFCPHCGADMRGEKND